MRAVIAAALVMGAAAYAKSSVAPGAKVNGPYLVNGGDGADWPSAGRDYDEQRFSPLNQINDRNVAGLGIAWFADLPDARGQEATPVMVDGVLYVTGPWSKVFAYDAVSGKALWTYDPKVDPQKGAQSCCDVVNRGVAVWKGKLYLGALDGRLIALDSRTGREVWSVQTTDPTKPYTITGVPRVVKDMVVIGNGGAEFGVRGYVTAYDSATGRKRWRFYTVPNAQGRPDGEASDPILAKAAAPTWSAGGQWRESGGGGTVWDAIVYDAALDQLYLGIGNGSPWNHQVRSEGRGDNLFLSSIVALDPNTGAYKWHYQETPGESWDYTATQPIILAELQGRKLLLHAPKNGFFFVIDRATGRPVSADMFTAVNWATGYDPATWRPIENSAARYGANGKPFLAAPSPIGAHSWQPMSFSPITGLVYLPVNDIGFGYIPPLSAEDMQRNTLGFNVGANMSEGMLPPDATFVKAAIAATKGALVAWDPVARKPRWRVEYPTPWNGGTLATAGNLVFQGTALGEFRAYAGDTGKQLWALPVQSGVMAAASTYAIRGVQYVAFTTSRGGAWALSSGYAGGAANRLPSIPRLIVLKLGGKARLPAPPARLITAFDPPPATGSADQVRQGKAIFGRFCQTCHGASAVSGGVTPDLRRSPVLADAASWKSVVIDGTLYERGMVSFKSVMDEAGAEAARAYVIGEANWAKAHDSDIMGTH
jgi:quinohemoprotein ethanol dehydrogenase